MSPKRAPEGSKPESAEPTAAAAKRELRLSTWVGIVAGIIGIPLTVATLYFLVFPRDEGCPGTRSGTLGDPTVDRVSYGDFLRITSQPVGGADEATLNRIGTIINVPFTAAGYRGKALPLRWTTLTAGGAPLAEPDLNDQLALEVVPEDCSDQGRRKFWVPRPRRAGHYLIEVTLLDDDGEPLDGWRTAAFTVPRRRARSASFERTRGRAIEPGLELADRDQLAPAATHDSRPPAMCSAKLA